MDCFPIDITALLISQGYSGNTKFDAKRMANLLGQPVGWASGFVKSLPNGNMHFVAMGEIKGEQLVVSVEAAQHETLKNPEAGIILQPIKWATFSEFYGNVGRGNETQIFVAGKSSPVSFDRDKGSAIDFFRSLPQRPVVQTLESIKEMRMAVLKKKSNRRRATWKRKIQAETGQAVDVSADYIWNARMLRTIKRKEVPGVFVRDKKDRLHLVSRSEYQNGFLGFRPA